MKLVVIEILIKYQKAVNQQQNKILFLVYKKICRTKCPISRKIDQTFVFSGWTMSDVRRLNIAVLAN